jgi:hypothetical protein
MSAGPAWTWRSRMQGGVLGQAGLRSRAAPDRPGGCEAEGAGRGGSGGRRRPRAGRGLARPRRRGPVAAGPPRCQDALPCMGGQGSIEKGTRAQRPHCPIRFERPGGRARGLRRTPEEGWVPSRAAGSSCGSQNSPATMPCSQQPRSPCGGPGRPAPGTVRDCAQGLVSGEGASRVLPPDD